MSRRSEISPLCAIEGEDNPLPFSLAGVPQISDDLAAKFASGSKLLEHHGQTLQQQIERATAELRRRWSGGNARRKAANRLLRRRLAQAASERGFELIFAPPEP